MELTPEEFERLKARVAEIDPLMVEAMADVDRTLLAWFQTLSPLERLDVGVRVARGEAEFKVPESFRDKG